MHQAFCLPARKVGRIKFNQATIGFLASSSWVVSCNGLMVEGWMRDGGMREPPSGSAGGGLAVLSCQSEVTA